VPSFGRASRARLDTCDTKIQDVLGEAIKDFDFSVICGTRGKEKQNKAYESGHSQLQWPNSKHNSTPSKAVDIVPWPGGFDNDDATFYKMATYIYKAANTLGVQITWGGHWTFKDLAHFQLED